MGRLDESIVRRGDDRRTMTTNNNMRHGGWNALWKVNTSRLWRQIGFSRVIEIWLETLTASQWVAR